MSSPSMAVIVKAQDLWEDGMNEQVRWENDGSDEEVPARTDGCEGHSRTREANEQVMGRESVVGFDFRA